MSAKKILVVDDQEQNVYSLKVRLEKVGYTVLEAFGGLEAIEIAGREIPDLILLDIMMPTINGFEVCQRLTGSKKTNHIPIILVTAVPKEEFVKKSFEVGAFDYVTKPFNYVELLHRINSALKLSESLQIVNEIREIADFWEQLNRSDAIVRGALQNAKKLLKEMEGKQLTQKNAGVIKENLNALKNELSVIEGQLNKEALTEIPAVLKRLKEANGKSTIN